MSDKAFLDNLRAFGLTGQEALIYEALLKHGTMTGYEVAKETGISRSNAYGSLSSLVDKGAAYVYEGEVTKYTPEDVNVFTGNVLKDLQKRAKELAEHAPGKADMSEGYITINGTANIKNKISDMLDKCELRLYILAEAMLLTEYRDDLETLVQAGKKVVILTDNFELKGATIYKTTPEKGQLRFITDSSFVLTGTLNNNDDDKCLYSGQSNLVLVMKEALRNKILLIQNNFKEDIDI
ncbi:MAG: TrmB family transcriptional regulator [Lachnospiraceae bacterium]|nr:TrmB family transcriptional regulator [Lachnospiraceae bacterium]